MHLTRIETTGAVLSGVFYLRFLAMQEMKGPGQESANQHRLNNKIQEIYELQICCIQ